MAPGVVHALCVTVGDVLVAGDDLVAASLVPRPARLRTLLVTRRGRAGA